MEGWTPLSFQADGSHAIVKLSTITNFHHVRVLLAVLINNVKKLLILMSFWCIGIHSPGGSDQ